MTLRQLLQTTGCRSRALRHDLQRWLPVLLIGLLAGCARDDAYPSRPITLVCPWSAGGGTDRVSRQIAVQLERELGVPVNVVNATGGAGVTGHTRAALARPDGYTLAMITPELSMLHWRGLTNITHRDFQPLMLLNRDNAAFFVRADAPWDNITDVGEAVRANSRGLKGAGTAFGGIWHIGVAGWLNKLELTPNDMIWISLNGSAPSLQELMAGGVDLVCCSVPEAQTLLDSGEIRCLAVLADERLPALPDVPTLKESGVDWSLGGWRGLALPLNVPADRVEVMLAAVKKVVTSDEYLKFLQDANFGAAAELPAKFEESLESSDEQYGAILTSDAFQQVQKQQFGPMVFPGVLAALWLTVLVAVLLTVGLKVPDKAEQMSSAGVLRIAYAIGFVVLYVLLADYVGFMITAAVLLLLFLCKTGVRLIVAAPVTLVLVPVVYQVFAVGMRVPLPWGWLGW